MPRFLDTFTGEFVSHSDPRMVPYAILSHTWRSENEGDEQSFNDLTTFQRAVDSECRRVQERAIEELKRPGLEILKPSQLKGAIPSSNNPPSCISTIFSHPRLSDKTKSICKVARTAGYRLLWIDSNCIDKSSSAELSEAINSTCEWYRLADVCYVYLADVSDDEDPTLEDSQFRRSRWHRRGWTLQELIAPERVVFLSATWRFLGTRTGLASTLENITRIDFDILTGRAALNSISVARRMSWAARRETTRVEDRAYSLLGIFGVHISPSTAKGRTRFSVSRRR